MADTQASEWLKWEGGPMPTSPFALVDIEERTGAVFENERAGDWDWRHENMDDDVVAYRLVKP